MKDYVTIITTSITLFGAISAVILAHYLRDRGEKKKDEREAKARISDTFLELELMGNHAMTMHEIFNKFDEGQKIPGSVYCAALNGMVGISTVFNLHVERISVLDPTFARKIREAYMLLNNAQSSVRNALFTDEKTAQGILNIYPSAIWEIYQQRIRIALEAVIVAKLARYGKEISNENKKLEMDKMKEVAIEEISMGSKMHGIESEE